MLRGSGTLLKKGWTHNPGRTRRGGKNLAWRPKLSERVLDQFVPLNLAFPRRHPNAWHELQFNLLGYTKWPKEVGFYNAGDNFELTPEAMFRLYLKNRDEAFWTRLHNEKVVVHLMPKVESDPKQYMERVNDIFRHHIKRFGSDHYIYNAVMQAAAFAKDLPRCEQLLGEMRSIGLEPNAQTYVNMMLAVRLAGAPREKAEAYFKEGVKTDALSAVMRLDTEFQMWMDQLERLGSFTAKSGYLSVNEEGAKPMPCDMWALWGWHRSEAKFISRKRMIDEQVRNRVRSGRELVGTVYSKSRRQPWAKYNGMFPFDYNGPARRRGVAFEDAPAPQHNKEVCETAF
ncbi:mitochondrial RNA binding complex 1 subunit [Trypanosoma conorhini]|uniref:Mitochondrial RNA binding complex 1 subunit n=1 Tax=Trypanosoma conorhini TaxID=83891 RepID=A0A3R7NHA9_9TRYP|nr:mitochondrial RNA binding complex 1 subunit [Trypanosoma conorhini]RNF22115.1 mitochondrial RNA binding complex 1 subunit [Trypanosoma conorhini]